MNILEQALEKIADPDKHIGLNVHKHVLQDIARKALADYRSNPESIKIAKNSALKYVDFDQTTQEK
jgi:hypothetical protein